MVAFLRFLEHREVVIELLSRFERGTINALELWILFVAFVVSARHAGELERADVSRAHDMRPGAKVDEIAVAIKRDFLVRRNVFDDVDLVFAWLIAIAQRGKPTFLSHLERFVARNFHALERMVCVDLLFHFRLDFLEIVGRDAVGKIDIVIKTVLYRRPGGELRFRPDFQNRRGEYMRRRVTQALDVGHRGALLQIFAFVRHSIERLLGPSRTSTFARNEQKLTPKNQKATKNSE